MQQEVDTLEDVVEPYLLHEGFVQRTPAGRRATPKAYSHLRLRRPADRGAQPELPLDDDATD
jgi:Holliday junction DNA helicase RuvB